MKKINWKQILDYLISLLKNFLEKKLVKLIITKVIKSAALTTPIGWVVSYLVDVGLDRIIIPMVNLGIRKGRLKYDQERGKLTVKRIDDAIENHDEDSFIDNIDNI
jgi:hypothetical protein